MAFYVFYSSNHFSLRPLQMFSQPFSCHYLALLSADLVILEGHQKVPPSGWFLEELSPLLEMHQLTICATLEILLKFVYFGACMKLLKLFFRLTYFPK